MSAIRERGFDWLINASVQIGLFAILAAVLSSFIAKAKAKYQHCFYLAIFALCLAAPVFNTPVANPFECGRTTAADTGDGTR